jgi:thiol-disulfide isomerase/thioredoxin
MFKHMPFTNIQRKVIVPMDHLTIPENVITELSKESFNDLLKTNQGLLIIKLGAEWCGPCKKIDPTVYEWFSKLSLKQNVKCAIIDIDESFDIYVYLKGKKVVNGVPVILCYFKGNLTWIPDKVVVGGDISQVNIFLEQCFELSNR